MKLSPFNIKLAIFVIGLAFFSTYSQEGKPQSYFNSIDNQAQQGMYRAQQEEMQRRQQFNDLSNRVTIQEQMQRRQQEQEMFQRGMETHRNFDRGYGSNRSW